VYNYICRHNGNILIDEKGHCIHIDFGFLLGISPGGNLGFESAAFKFSPEMIELLDGFDSPMFDYFVTVAIRGFLVARQHLQCCVTLISSFVDSGLPCFMYKPGSVDAFKGRFFPELDDIEAGLKFRELIMDAADKWTTACYDGIQKLQNNIYSDYWH